MTDKGNLLSLIERDGTSGSRRLAARVWRLLQDRTLAVALLSAALVSCILGSLIPQRGIVSPTEHYLWSLEHQRLMPAVELLGLDNVYSSWWFLALWGLLFLSVTACTLNRIGREFPVLRRRVSNPMTWRRFGSIGFHLGMALVFLGALVSTATRFTGFVEVSEGQAFMDQPGRYSLVREGLAPAIGAEGFGVYVEGISTQTWPDGSTKDLAASVVVLDKGVPTARKVVRRNDPLTYSGATVNLSNQYGPSFLISVRKRDGGVAKGYINLPAPTVGENTVQASAAPGDSGLRIDLEATVPWADQGPGVDWDKLRLEPEVAVKLWRQQELLYEGPLALAESKQLGEISITLEDSVLWTVLFVVRDPGVPLIFAGMFVGTAALGMALFQIPIPAAIRRRVPANGNAEPERRPEPGIAPALRMQAKERLT